MSRASVPLFIGCLPRRFGTSGDLTGPRFLCKYFRYPVGNIRTHSSFSQTGNLRMLYAILCYHDEDFVGSWTKEQDAAVMNKLAVVQDKLTKEGRLGPVPPLVH